MTVTIKQLKDSDASLVRNYLAGEGLDGDVIDWKYFDDEFNQGRNRGYVAHVDDRPVGFIGLIPFTATAAGKTFETAWTCDWSVAESEKNRTVGVAVLREAIRANPTLFHVGGNVITRRIFDRLATSTVAESVRDYVMPLRASLAISRLKKRFPLLAPLEKSSIARMPIRRIGTRRVEPGVEVVPGVDTRFLVTTRAQDAGAVFSPAYDLRHLQWLIGRCPTLKSYSFIGRDDVAALVWHLAGGGFEWRLAINSTHGNEGALRGIIRSIVAFAYARGADVVRTRVSGHDEALCAHLGDLGFLLNRHVPFYAFYHPNESAIYDAQTGLSFLDCDESLVRMR